MLVMGSKLQEVVLEEPDLIIEAAMLMTLSLKTITIKNNPI